MNLNNFTIKSQEAVQQSVQLVSQRGQQVIEAAHILKAVILTGESVVNFLFQKLGVSVAAVRDPGRLAGGFWRERTGLRPPFGSARRTRG